VTLSPFDAISDSTRRQILDTLRAGPQRAGDLAARFPRISRPAVSKHLRVLRGAKLVHQEKRGRELWYQLSPLPFTQIHSWLDKYEAFWSEKLVSLKRAAEED
jgi:DNA-binding transcriptional ArsR family regulator